MTDVTLPMIEWSGDAFDEVLEARWKKYTFAITRARERGYQLRIRHDNLKSSHRVFWPTADSLKAYAERFVRPTILWTQHEESDTWLGVCGAAALRVGSLQAAGGEMQDQDSPRAKVTRAAVVQVTWNRLESWHSAPTIEEGLSWAEMQGRVLAAIVHLDPENEEPTDA